MLLRSHSQDSDSKWSGSQYLQNQNQIRIFCFGNGQVSAASSFLSVEMTGMRPNCVNGSRLNSSFPVRIKSNLVLAWNDSKRRRELVGMRLSSNESTPETESLKPVQPDAKAVALAQKVASWNRRLLSWSQLVSDSLEGKNSWCYVSGIETQAD